LASDTQLVARVRQGDVEAFGQLTERYQRSLLALAVARLRDFHQAEDVVQAALLLAFRRLATLRDGAKFGAWLTQITHRQVIEAARSRAIPASIVLDGCQDLLPAGMSDTAWIEKEHLLGLVARLPERERVLIGLRYFDGHSVAEIASISMRPVGTVTKQLSRALARLRSWSNKETHDES
jgi:RNA polymerase sigma-70 factor, ECF subfamily